MGRSALFTLPEDDLSTSTNDVVLGFAIIGLVLFVICASVLGVPETSSAELATAQKKASALDTVWALYEATHEEHYKTKSRLVDYMGAEMKLSQELEAEKTKVAALQERIEELEKSPKSKETPIGELTPLPTDVCFMIDGTLSMKPILVALQKGILAVASIGSRLSPRFRICVVVYRSSNTCDEFPLTEIGPTIDGVPSSGMVKLKAFLEDKDKRASVSTFASGSEVGKPTGKSVMVSSMDPLAGFADVERGVRSGIAALRIGGSDGNSRPVLILCGDVGVHEGGKDPEKLEDEDKRRAAVIGALVGGFALRFENARVWSVFAGKDVVNHPLRSESSDFFKSIAAAAREKGRYTDDVGDLTAAAVEAIFGDIKR